MNFRWIFGLCSQLFNNYYYIILFGMIFHLKCGFIHNITSSNCSPLEIIFCLCCLSHPRCSSCLALVMVHSDTCKFRKCHTTSSIIIVHINSIVYGNILSFVKTFRTTWSLDQKPFQFQNIVSEYYQQFA